MKVLIPFLCAVALHVPASLSFGSDSLNDDIKAILKDLKNANPRTRASAIEEIGHRGAVRASDVKEAIPLVLDLLKKDRDANVRKAAATALAQMDPEPSVAVPALMQALRDKVPNVRSAAASGLGLLGDAAKEAIPALQEAQKDKDRTVSRAAAMAIRSIRKKK